MRARLHPYLPEGRLVKQTAPVVVIHVVSAAALRATMFPYDPQMTDTIMSTAACVALPSGICTYTFLKGHAAEQDFYKAFFYVNASLLVTCLSAFFGQLSRLDGAKS